MDYARLVWCRYVAAGTDLTGIPTLEELNALTQPGSPATSAAMDNVGVFAEQLPSSLAGLDDGDDQKIPNMVAVEAEARVGVKRCLCNLQESCRARRRKVPESVVEAVGLAVELANGVAVAPPGAVAVADSCIDDLSEQVASMRAEVISLTTKL